MHTLRQYLATISDSYGLTRTLGEIEPLRDAPGQPLYTAGNSAIVFRIQRQGRLCSLRCYRRPMRHLREIYGERLLERELYLHTSPDHGVWVDVVVGGWIEGVTLHEAITAAVDAADGECLHRLATAFDHLAAELVTDDWAHGDLKPENIIVDPAGALHLIDLDAQFLPSFADEPSPELGTAAYQHPARCADDFNSAVDDYPTALISTALHALALDPSLGERYKGRDGLLFSPQHIATDAALNETLALFEARGMARHYRVAELLRSSTYRLFGLGDLFTTPTTISHLPFETFETFETFEAHGKWGFRTTEGVAIPALYDCTFDFSEGLAAVRLHHSWHFIDTTGGVALSCPDCEAVKPFRDGRATLIRRGQRTQIDHNGNEFDS